MKPADAKPPADLTLVQRVPDGDDDEEQFKPLEWSLVRRLFTYTRPVSRKRNLLFALTIVRSAQLPALVWISTLVIKGPIAQGDFRGIILGIVGYAILAILTEFMFHFRQRYALEVGETVVNAIRAEIFAKIQRQPLSTFQLAANASGVIPVGTGRAICQLTSCAASTPITMVS